MQSSRVRLLFVSGKGGVGKSLTAAAIALAESKRGRRVLLVEIGESSYFKDCWHLPTVGYQPVRTGFGFDLALWNAEACLHEYVLHYLKVESLYRLFFANRVMRTLINVAPGLSEIAILGKLTSGVRHVGPVLDYDLIVVDSFATGHALSMLKAPIGLMEAIKYGPMGSHSRDIAAVLRDSELTGYTVVTLLEELPVTEALEFAEQIKSIYSLDCDFIANKELAPPLSLERLTQLEQGLPGADPLKEFSRHILAVMRRQSELIGLLRGRVKTLIRLPMVFQQDATEVTRVLGESLRAN